MLVETRDWRRRTNDTYYLGQGQTRTDEYFSLWTQPKTSCAVMWEKETQHIVVYLLFWIKFTLCRTAFFFWKRKIKYRRCLVQNCDGNFSIWDSALRLPILGEFFLVFREIWHRYESCGMVTSKRAVFIFYYINFWNQLSNNRYLKTSVGQWTVTMAKWIQINEEVCAHHPLQSTPLSSSGSVAGRHTNTGHL